MNTANPAPLAHDVNTAAARLGIGRVKLYELINSGEIKSFRIGAKRLIPESELQRFVAEQMQREVAA